MKINTMLIGPEAALDTPPVASGHSTIPALPSVESVITLNYTDSDQASSCALTGLTNVSVTTPCACSSGVCTVGVRSPVGFNGLASFNYTVTANGRTSNSAAASLNVVPGPTFVTRWKTDNPGSSPNQITLPLTTISNYNFIVDWGDGQSSEVTTWDDPDSTHIYASPGTYTIKMTGLYESISFNGHDDREKILDVISWGTNQWNNMMYAFRGCTNLNISAADAPDLTNVGSLRGMFAQATNFNSPIDHWDVSTISDMTSLFTDATSFNQSLIDWDVSNVQMMNEMFKNATSFDQPLGSYSSATEIVTGWDTSQVTEMNEMFSGASSFNQPLDQWQVNQVSSANNFDTGATSWVAPRPNFPF